MIGALAAVLRRDLALAVRAGAGAELGLMFFLILIVLVPFAIGPDRQAIGTVAPAVLWLGALLATLFGLDRLLQSEEEEGSLDLLLGAVAPLELILLAKALAHWLVTGLPLSLAAPLLGVMLAIEPAAMLPLAGALLVGTPAVTLVGLVGAALTVSLRRGGLLIAVVVLPLCVPTLIFGVAAVRQAALGEAAATPFLFLAGLTLLMLVVAPVAAAAALRLARE